MTDRFKFNVKAGEEKQMTGEKHHLVYELKANDYLDKYRVR